MSPLRLAERLHWVGTSHQTPSDDARLAFALVAALLAGGVVSRLAGGHIDRVPLRFERYLVNVNAAPAGEIEALPGVGPVLAARIIAARIARAFGSADDLDRVQGVGPATIERLRAFVRCGGR